MVLAAILLAALGRKVLSLISLSSVVIMGVGYMSRVTEAMGVWCAIYFIAMVVGILLYCAIDPAVSNTVYDTAYSLKYGKKLILGNMQNVGAFAERNINAIGSVVKRITSKKGSDDTE